MNFNSFIYNLLESPFTLTINKENSLEYKLKENFLSITDYYTSMKILLIEDIKSNIEQELEIINKKPCQFLKTDIQSVKNAQSINDEYKGNCLVLKLSQEDGKELPNKEFIYNIEGHISLVILLFINDQAKQGITIGITENINAK